MIDKEPCKTLEENNQEKVLQNTSYYLENYLNPNKNWDRQVSAKERINWIRHSNVNWKIVSDYIKEMDYQDFLRTPYWKAITAHSKFKARYRCQVCNSPHGLVTHHRNYAIHGFEHVHMHELVVLCHHCHNMFHYKTPKSEHKAKAALVILVVKLMILSALAGHFFI